MRALSLTTLVLSVAFSLACGGATLHSPEARKELRDCRRAGDTYACVSVGQRYVDGDEADRDIDRAYRLLRRACRDNPYGGCAEFGILGLTEAEAGFSIDDVVEELERSCRRYAIDGCDVLIMVLETEDGGAYDPDYAQRIRDRLCYDGFEGFCFRDTDGDGLDDDEDDCPDEPEDVDGFEDSNGCPDPDNDGDGVADTDDTCPDIAEDADGFEDADGCIDFDNDGDQILDVDDGCPDIAEDVDGFEDADGCVDSDNDRDGIVDESDDCPDTAEDFDGFEDSDGCPEAGEGLVTLTCEQIEIREAVYFAVNSDVIEERSFPLLDQVAGVLSAASYIMLVEVAGHTDDTGEDAMNMDLSQRRADSVVRYLVAAGVASERLRGVGYGETRPIAPNTTVTGRDTNRRVEFQVVEQDSNCATP